MLRVAAPFSPVDHVLRCLARGQRPFLLDALGDDRFSYAGCDPGDGFSWQAGDAGDPLALLEAAQRRWTVGPVDEHWPLAIGFIDTTPRGEVDGVDLLHYRALLRIDARQGTAEVLAHDAASGEALLARLRRLPQPLHEFDSSTLDEAVLTNEAALTVYLSQRADPRWRRSAFVGGEDRSRWCAAPRRALRVETVRAEGHYATWRMGDSDERIPADGSTATLIAKGVGDGVVGWIGAGRALDFSRVESHHTVRDGQLTVGRGSRGDLTVG